MGLPWLQKVTQRVTFVNTDDDAVTPKNGATGWILSSKASMGDGAVRIVARPLNARERDDFHARYVNTVKVVRDEDGKSTAVIDTLNIAEQKTINRDYFRASVVDVSGLPADWSTDQFVDWLDTDDIKPMVDVLQAITAGEQEAPEDGGTFPEDDGA